MLQAPPCTAGIDWQQPWFAPFEPFARACNGVGVAEALNAARQVPVQFVSQAGLPPGQPYEQFIFATHTVPTRDNLHDFFNGLCWMRFPQTKKKLNQLQAAELSRRGVRPQRGPLGDALTMFDENAALLLAPEPIWDALLLRDWRRVFVELRPLWAQARLVLFGHALLEKLVDPRKSVTAHIYRAAPDIKSIANDWAGLDAWVAADLTADKLRAKPFVPLPVLGVPGWWPENENFSFYDDSNVFRPRRQEQQR